MRFCWCLVIWRSAYSLLQSQGKRRVVLCNVCGFWCLLACRLCVRVSVPQRKFRGRQMHRSRQRRIRLGRFPRLHQAFPSPGMMRQPKPSWNLSRTRRMPLMACLNHCWRIPAPMVQQQPMQSMTSTRFSPGDRMMRCSSLPRAFATAVHMLQCRSIITWRIMRRNPR